MSDTVPSVLAAAVTRRRFLTLSASAAAAVATTGRAGSSFAATRTPRVLWAHQFGAVGDGRTDDAPALRSALAAATRAGTGATLSLRPGTYRLASSGPAGYALDVSAARDLRLSGSGSTLVVANPELGCLRVVGSTGFRVDDLTIDYNPHPSVHAVLLAINVAEGSVDVLVPDAGPTWDDAAFARSITSSQTANFGAVFDPATRRLRAGVSDHFRADSVQRLSGRTFRLWLVGRRVPPRWQTGDRLVYLVRAHGHALSLYRSPQASVHRVSVQAANSVAFAIFQSDAARITESRVGRPPGSDRLVSTNADAVHAQGCRRGPLVEGCSFEGMMDDGFNAYAQPMVVRSASSDGRDLLVTASALVQVGDLIQLTDPQTGGDLGVRRAARAQVGSNGLTRLRLDGPVSGVRAGQDHRDAHTAYNLNASSAGYVVRNTTFSEHRGMGLRLRAGGGVVEGNRIRGVSNRAVLVSNDPDWPEGPFGAGTVIRDNVIEDVGYASERGAIEVTALRLGRTTAIGYPQRGIVIERNSITDWRGPALSVSAARDVVLRDNRLRLGEAVSGLDTPALGVVLRQCRARVDGLTVEAGASRLPAAITLLPDGQADVIARVTVPSGMLPVAHASA